MKSPLAFTIDEVASLVIEGLNEVFSTLFQVGVSLRQEPGDFWRSDPAIIAGNVGFTGEVNGVVYVYFQTQFADRLAVRMLGLEPADPLEPELVNDVVGELSNMIVGSTKSRLCDLGQTCVLTIPSVVRGQQVGVASVGTAKSRLLTIDCGGECIFVKILLK